MSICPSVSMFYLEEKVRKHKFVPEKKMKAYFWGESGLTDEHVK